MSPSQHHTFAQRGVARGPARGQATIVFALLGTLAMGFVGLTVDTGYAQVRSRQDQGAADAASLAAAHQIGNNNSLATAKAWATRIAADNGCAPPACSVTLHFYDAGMTEVSAGAAPNTVYSVGANVGDTRTTNFIQLVGGNRTFTVASSARAAVAPPVPVPPPPAAPRTPSPGAGVTFNATVMDIQLQAPTSGPLAGVLFYFDRSNNAYFNLTGTTVAGPTMSGAWYGASSKLYFAGTGAGPDINFDQSLVFYDLELVGTCASLHIRTPAQSIAGCVTVGGAPPPPVGPLVAPCGLCLLDPGPFSLSDGGTESELLVGAGSLLVNGDLYIPSRGPLNVASGQFKLGGRYYCGSGCTPCAYCSPIPQTYQPAFTDPLAALPVPSTAGLPVVGDVTVTADTTLNPGIYGTIDVGAAAPLGTTVTFNPGVYVFAAPVPCGIPACASGGLTVAQNNAVLKGSGVTMYFTCGTPSARQECGTAGAPPPAPPPSPRRVTLVD